MSGVGGCCLLQRAMCSRVHSRSHFTILVSFSTSVARCPCAQSRVDQIIREARDLDQARLGLLSAASAKVSSLQGRTDHGPAGLCCLPISRPPHPSPPPNLASPLAPLD